MTGWLLASERDRPHSMVQRATTTLFLRDDDIGQLTPAARAFMRIFRERDIPVSYQVIPALLTDECAAFLQNFHQDRPDLIELGQHGLRHEMSLGGRRLSWEFGREVDYATQRERIATGRAIMTAKLGSAFDGRMFTPPRHRFNADTVRAAADEGFDIFSAAAYVDLPRRLVYAFAKSLGIGSIRNRGIAYHPERRPEAPIRELSIAIPMDHGVPRPRRLADVLADIDRAAQVSSVVGMMFHHAAWQTADDHRFLGDLAEALLARSDTQLALPRDIAGA